MRARRGGPAAPGLPGWRLKWVQRENERRLSQHASRDQRWQADLDDLNRMLGAARSFEGGTTHQDSSLVLKKGERIYFALRLVTLIEARVPATAPVSTDSSFSFRVTRNLRFNSGVTRGEAMGTPEEMRVVDHGGVTVTDRRMVFQGGKHAREWAFAKLLSLEHSSAQPYTLIQVANRKKGSGVLYPPSSAAAFRFNLALALAVFNDNRQGLVASLDRERQELIAIRPVLPPPALPEQAPLSLAAANALKNVYFGRPGQRPARRVVQGAATSVLTLLVLLAFVGAVMPKTSTTQAGSALPAVTPSPTTTTQTAIPAPPTPSTIATPKPRPRPAPTHRIVASPPPRPKPSPTHVVVNLCGAPTNPWGYNFCGGGHIYSPAPDICAYFNCIANFPNGVGYVVQCVDGMLSKSGGRQGACSYHGGERRPHFD